MAVEDPFIVAAQQATQAHNDYVNAMVSPHTLEQTAEAARLDKLASAAWSRYRETRKPFGDDS